MKNHHLLAFLVILLVLVWGNTVEAETPSTACSHSNRLCRNLKDFLVTNEDPSYKYLTIRNQQSLSAGFDVVLMTYTKPRTKNFPGTFKLGIFVVQGSSKRHWLTIALRKDFLWDLKRASERSLVITMHGDYGNLLKKIKYFFDLSAQKVLPPQEFQEVRVNQARVFKDQLFLSAIRHQRGHPQNSFILQLSDKKRDGETQFWSPQIIRAIVDTPIDPIMVIQKNSKGLQFVGEHFQYVYKENHWKKSKIFNTLHDGQPVNSVKPLGFPQLQVNVPLAVVQEHILDRTNAAKGNGRFLVWNPPINSLESHSTGIWIRGREKARYLPLPQPSEKVFLAMRPRVAWPGEGRGSQIGPFQFWKGNIWFGLTFLNMGGQTGLGGYGYFDTQTHKYHLHYVSEWAAWAASAFYKSQDSIWVGIRNQGDGPAIPGGVLQYHSKTRAVIHYEIPEVVFVIQKYKNFMVFGTANGIWVLDNEHLIPGYFTVDQKGIYQLEWEKAIAVTKLGKKPSPD